MTPGNSYPLLVEPKLVKLPADHVFHQHYWAQPSVEHLRVLMRRVVTAGAKRGMQRHRRLHVKTASLTVPSRAGGRAREGSVPEL